VRQGSQSVNVCRFGFKLQNRPLLVAKGRDKFPAKIRPGFPDQAVGEFTRSNSMNFISAKDIIKLLEQVVMIDKILHQGWMEIRLQDAIGTVHMAISSNMQYFITTTGIASRTRTFFYKRTSIAGKKKNCFSL